MAHIQKEMMAKYLSQLAAQHNLNGRFSDFRRSQAMLQIRNCLYFCVLSNSVVLQSIYVEVCLYANLILVHV